MEWFDWNVYATFSAFFAPQFFAGDDTGTALLKTLAVFAVGFVARPFGGFLFGWIADRRGRKLSMALCVATAAVGSLVIGLVPTHAVIGIAAPVVLVLARLAQGLAHGRQAHSQRPGDPPHRKTFPRLQLAGHNLVPQLAVGALTQRFSAAAGDGLEGGQMLAQPAVGHHEADA